MPTRRPSIKVQDTNRFNKIVPGILRGLTPENTHLRCICPHCDNHLNSSMRADDGTSKGPKPGDASFCAHCERISLFAHDRDGELILKEIPKSHPDYNEYMRIEQEMRDNV